MKNIWILVILFTMPVLTFGQNTIDFQPGIEIVDLKKQPGYDAPLSLRFVFNGQVELRKHYENLKKHITKQFSITDVKLEFEINLADSQEMESSSQPEAICTIEINDIQALEEELEEIRRQRYSLAFSVHNTRTHSIQLEGQYNIKSLDHIGTQNRNVAEELFMAILSR